MKGEETSREEAREELKGWKSSKNDLGEKIKTSEGTKKQLHGVWAKKLAELAKEAADMEFSFLLDSVWGGLPTVVRSLIRGKALKIYEHLAVMVPEIEAKCLTEMAEREEEEMGTTSLLANLSSQHMSAPHEACLSVPGFTPPA